jgi:hypothetical protein
MTAVYKNPWSDDWIYTTAAEQSTDATPTIDTIRRAIRKFQEKWKDADLGPDVWVLTHAQMQDLKLEMEKRDPFVAWCGGSKDPLSIYGIRVEEYATKEEVRARVIELAANGIRAGFLKSEEDK